MNFQKMCDEFKLGLGLLLFVCAMRVSLPPILPHLSNFSPLLAAIMMSTSFFQKPLNAMVFTLLSLVVSDVFVNAVMYHHMQLFYAGFVWQYAAYAAVFVLGLFLSLRASLKYYMAGALGSSLLFYIVSNFGVWMSAEFYPKTIEGLFACYLAGIPFLQNTMLSNLVFTIVLYVGSQSMFRGRVLVR